MNTLRKLFIPLFAFICIICACNGLENAKHLEVSQENIQKTLQGTWEVIHVSGYAENWNEELHKEEIVSINRDVVLSKDDDWCTRVNFNNGAMTFYRYNGTEWSVSSQGSYSVKDKKIIAQEENGKKELSIVSMEENKVVFDMPIKSDPTKATRLTVKRI